VSALRAQFESLGNGDDDMLHTVNKLLAVRSVAQVELERVLPRRVGQAR